MIALKDQEELLLALAGVVCSLMHIGRLGNSFTPDEIKRIHSIQNWINARYPREASGTASHALLEFAERLINEAELRERTLQ